MTQYQKELLHDYEEDVADCERAVKAAENELEDAHDWLDKQKLHYAEAIIKLNEFKKTL